MRAMARMGRDREDDEDGGGSSGTTVTSSARERKGTAAAHREAMMELLSELAKAIREDSSSSGNAELQEELKRQKCKVIKLDEDLYDMKKAMEKAKEERKVVKPCAESKLDFLVSQIVMWCE